MSDESKKAEESHTTPTGRERPSLRKKVLLFICGDDPFHGEWNAPLLPPSSPVVAQLM
jgi:hypothetical protein